MLRSCRFPAQTFDTRSQLLRAMVEKLNATCNLRNSRRSPNILVSHHSLLDEESLEFDEAAGQSHIWHIDQTSIAE